MTESTDGISGEHRVGFRSMVCCGLGFAIAWGVTDPVQAQNFERYRPQPVELSPIPQVPDLGKPAPVVQPSDEVLVANWDAVIIRDNPRRVQANDAFEDAIGVQFDLTRSGTWVPQAELTTLISESLGGPLTLRRLNELSARIINYYRKQGRPMVDVVIPEQKITGGTVQIVLVESLVGQVRIEGNCWSSTNRLGDLIRCTQPGGPIEEARLQQDLFRLNDYPFRRVELDLKPGTDFGTSDVLFQVRDRMPLRAYMGYDDTGVQALNYERLLAGITIGSLMGNDSLLSYQATGDGNLHRLQAHSVVYQRPVGTCHWFETYGSWAEVNPRVGLPVNQEGQSWQTGMAIGHRLSHSPDDQRSLALGFDFKSTNTNVEFGGVNVFGSSADLVTLRLSYRDFQRFEDDEYRVIRNDLFVGPGGGFTGDHNAAAFQTIRPGTSPDFVYNRLSYERMRNLPRAWQWIGRGTGQLSSERLLFSETLGLGGFDSVRGYDQRSLNADAGWFLNFEVGPQPWTFGTGRGTGRVRAYGFVDFGESYILNALPGEDRNSFVASSGLGTRMSLNDQTSLRVDYGYGFQDDIAPRHHRVHVGLIRQFGAR